MITITELVNFLIRYISDSLSKMHLPSTFECNEIISTYIILKTFDFNKEIAEAIRNHFETKDQYQYYQVIQIAESIMNVQGEAGFDSIKQSISQNINNFEKLDHDLTVLTCARLLSRVGMPITFVTPTGKKGHDYDLRTKCKDGSDLVCEVKSKQDGKISLKSYISSLKKADGQMYTSGTKMVFVKVPKSWALEDEFEFIRYLPMASPIKNYFLNDTILMWDEIINNNWILSLTPSIVQNIGDNVDKMNNGMMHYLTDTNLGETPNNNFTYITELVNTVFAKYNSFTNKN